MPPIRYDDMTMPMMGAAQKGRKPAKAAIKSKPKSGLKVAQDFWLNDGCLINLPHSSVRYWQDRKRAQQHAKTLQQQLRDQDDLLIQLQILGYHAWQALRSRKLRSMLEDVSLAKRDRLALLLDCAFALTLEQSLGSAASYLGQEVLEKRCENCRKTNQAGCSKNYPKKHSESCAKSADYDRLTDQCAGDQLCYHQMVRNIFSLEVVEVFLELTHDLLGCRRLNFLGNILDSFQELNWQKHRICPVKVWTAVPLTSVQEKTIKERVWQRYGMQARLQNYLEPGMLGGMIIELFNRRIDNSISSVLKRLQAFLSKECDSVIT